MTWQPKKSDPPEICGLTRPGFNTVTNTIISYFILILLIYLNIPAFLKPEPYSLTIFDFMVKIFKWLPTIMPVSCFKIYETAGKERL